MKFLKQLFDSPYFWFINFAMMAFSAALPGRSIGEQLLYGAMAVYSYVRFRKVLHSGTKVPAPAAPEYSDLQKMSKTKCPPHKYLYLDPVAGTGLHCQICKWKPHTS